MADWSKPKVLGEVDNVPIRARGMTHALTFLVLNKTPVTLIIGRPVMEMMQASLNFDKDIAVSRSGEHLVVVPLWTDKKKTGRSFSEEITSEEEDDTDVDSSKESEENFGTKEEGNKAP